MNLPNKLTVLRLILIPAFVALYLIQFPFHEFVALGVFLIACITDFLDGYIARKYNLVTDLGKFLDPIADKVLVMSALVLLCISTLNPLIQITYAITTIIVLAREFIISGFRMIAAGKNIVLAADSLGKTKTVLQMISIILLLVSEPIMALSVNSNFYMVSVMIFGIGLALLVLSLVFTILSAINYIAKNPTVLKMAKPEENKDAE